MLRSSKYDPNLKFALSGDSAVFNAYLERTIFSSFDSFIEFLDDKELDILNKAEEDFRGLVNTPQPQNYRGSLVAPHLSLFALIKLHSELNNNSQTGFEPRSTERLDMFVEASLNKPSISIFGRATVSLAFWGLSISVTEEPVIIDFNLELTLRNHKPFNKVFLGFVSGKTASLRKRADFYREVTPPDQLSSLTQGTPVGRSDNPDGTSVHSSLPNGDSARNIGRPSPDSPNLKYRNLDRAEAYGRTPADVQDFGYVHDSGSGSARVIPYDSGFVNNTSAIRTARLANRYMISKGFIS